MDASKVILKQIQRQQKLLLKALDGKLRSAILVDKVEILIQESKHEIEFTLPVGTLILVDFSKAHQVFSAKKQRTITVYEGWWRENAIYLNNFDFQLMDS